MSGPEKIVRNPEMLDDAYVVSSVSARDLQIQELISCLRPALEGKRPVHAWLHGRPGTGKTLVAKFVMRQLSRQGNLAGIYVNCWEHNSYYAVLDKLVRELRILGAEKLNTSFKLERFRLFVGSRPFVIILDEIDQTRRMERDSILYNLCGIGSVGLICISNSAETFLSLDERIKSRLSARHIEFGCYSPGRLTNILRQRAEFGLAPGSWDDAVIGKILEFAEGDARIAIRALRNAALNAEADGSPSIGMKHIMAGQTSARDFRKEVLLAKLSSHHRLLYDLVKQGGEINSGELWEAYLAESRRLGRPAIALRTFSEYMNRLIELELVRWDRALVRGKVRVFRVENGKNHP